MHSNNLPSLTYDFNSSESFLTRIPASAKIMLVLAFALCIALLSSVSAQLFLLGYSFMLIFLAKIQLRALIKRVLSLDGFLIFLWLTLPFSGPHGVELALSITIRTHAAVFAFMALLGTTSIGELLYGLRALAIPQKLVLLLHFTYRYARVFVEEAEKIYTSMTLRMFHPSLSLGTLRSYGNLIGMLLVRSILRSERVAHAMELRGFDGSFHFLESPASPKEGDNFRLGVLYILLAGCFIL
ncbi:MAG TPA: cobalt ECF transporter T component CbiQ [Aminobacterium sp.]|jgi:cobalt/nickel transport system permease protein|uniref:cobalt ECF transporter T component CbiQ n=1 Tax=Aminobacterium TaxID=81466 RepID=UPI000EC2BD2A|nr:cobalt ECF transporter T component CbiQ [Aminobacterium sp. UBA4834]HCA40372.1 cobalt ECF transporter T component CbiQ [Aminobacterium sp.]